MESYEGHSRETSHMIELIEQMKTDRVANYVLPGLDSYLLQNGKVRLFQSSRNTMQHITPHSHRFDLFCLVLSGKVHNRLWYEHPNGDLFMMSKLIYHGTIGQHTVVQDNIKRFYSDSQYYTAGDIYSMTHEEIHSIQFEKDTNVLFLEGPNKSNHSFIIEPRVNNETIETYKKEDYMFLNIPTFLEEG